MELQELILKEVESGQVAEYSEVEAQLSQLEQTYGAEVPDASTKTGYQRAKDIASEMTALRTALENKRKDFKAPVLTLGKMIDSQAKAIKERIEAIENPFKLAYRAVDDEKKRIKEEIEQRIIEIKNAPQTAMLCQSPVEVEEMINKFAELDICYETFGRRQEEAADWLASILPQLGSVLTQKMEEERDAIRREAEFAELEALRREKAESEAAEQAEANAAAAEQERQRIAEQAAEQARQAEIARQKREAEQAAAEQARREANIKHVSDVRKQAKLALIGLGLDEQQAKSVVMAIHHNKIPNIKIEY